MSDDGRRSTVAVNLRGGSAYLTMDDGARNAMTLEWAADLLEAVRAATVAEARIIVLQGNSKSFSVGGDLRSFGESEEPSRYIDDLAEGLHRVISELGRSEAIVVAAVRGVAAGAGMPLAAAADIIVAEQSARFTLGYTRIGLSPDGGSTLLSATVGLHTMLQWTLLNPQLSAAQAQAAGLVARVCEDGGLDEEVERVVAELAAVPWQAQVAAKRLIRDRALPDAETAMRKESLAVRAAAAQPHSAELIRAFLDRRA
ncbi:MAG: enoyl-CoA hydratase-related protein [Actinomycetota bacterium]|nr:enoyl-CoA hydratase-related protein [Actinomycetota bacterium]